MTFLIPPPPPHPTQQDQSRQCFGHDVMSMTFLSRPPPHPTQQDQSRQCFGHGHNINDVLIPFHPSKTKAGSALGMDVISMTFVSPPSTPPRKTKAGSELGHDVISMTFLSPPHPTQQDQSRQCLGHGVTSMTFLSPPPARPKQVHVECLRETARILPSTLSWMLF